MTSAEGEETYQANDRLQPHAIPNPGVVCAQLHVCVHLDECSAAFGCERDFHGAIEPHWHQAARLPGRGSDLPAKNDASADRQPLQSCHRL